MNPFMLSSLAFIAVCNATLIAMGCFIANSRKRNKDDIVDAVVKNNREFDGNNYYTFKDGEIVVHNRIRLVKNGWKSHMERP